MSTKSATSEPNEKLQKLLAHLGHGSRREMEIWIAAGRVSVDGSIAHTGMRVTPGQYICIDGKPIKSTSTNKSTPRILLYHKPCGQICSRSDTEGRPTVFENLPKLRQGRWVMVGRLDINTSGLLLFTTDGELAHRLMHPSYQIEREYAVRVYGKVSDEILALLQAGVPLEDGIGKFYKIIPHKPSADNANRWFNVILREGRNRLVRRLWQSQNIQVNRLIRVRFGPLELPRSLEEGHFVELEKSNSQALYQQVATLPAAEATL